MNSRGQGQAGWWQEEDVARAARKEPAATAASVPSCVYTTLRIRSVSRYACLMSKPVGAWVCVAVCVCIRVCALFFMMTCQTFMQNANLKPKS